MPRKTWIHRLVELDLERESRARAPIITNLSSEVVPMRYRRKPGAVIEAEQLTREAIEAHVFEGAPLPRGVTLVSSSRYPTLRKLVECRLVVTTIHGQETDVIAGDWILPEPDGEHFYPCKPDIFATNYEPVEG